MSKIKTGTTTDWRLKVCGMCLYETCQIRDQIAVNGILYNGCLFWCLLFQNNHETSLPSSRGQITHKCSYLVILVYPIFYSCDPITSIYELDQDILKLYPHTENDVYRLRLPKVSAWTGQIDRQTDKTKCTTEVAFTGGEKKSVFMLC